MVPSYTTRLKRIFTSAVTQSHVTKNNILSQIGLRNGVNDRRETSHPFANSSEDEYISDDDAVVVVEETGEASYSFINGEDKVDGSELLIDVCGNKSEVADPLVSDGSGLSSSTYQKKKNNIISFSAINMIKEIGVGEFGVVQQGVWSDSTSDPSRTVQRQVAVKCLTPNRMQNNAIEFLKEFEIMQSLTHDNIVKLYGLVYEQSSQIMLITELAPLRSLLECLKEDNLRATLTVQRLSQFAMQVCCGMQYLEENRLIHRDLAARNILVFNKDLVKISDFGLSRALGVGKDYYQTNFSLNLKLPIAWCAPECINYLKFTSSSDVWAFGVTLWEIFSYGFQPWAACSGQQILESIDEPNFERLVQPDHCPAEHYAIMQQCWIHDPQLRPSFSKLYGLLDDARPEQVIVVESDSTTSNFNGTMFRQGLKMLNVSVDHIITVLDKNVSKDSLLAANNGLWCGTVDSTSQVGFFNPTYTVTYLGNLPSMSTSITSQHHLQHPSEHKGVVVGPSKSSVFSRSSSSRGSRLSSTKKKFSRDMISGPQGEVKHTGHMGPDGIYFGHQYVGSNVPTSDTIYAAHCTSNVNVAFNTTDCGGGNGGNRKCSDGSSGTFTSSMFSLTSSSSECAPLINVCGGALVTPKVDSNLIFDDNPPHHEYHSIGGGDGKEESDDTIIGKSFMDEVFDELKNSSRSAAPIEAPSTINGTNVKRSLKERVSNVCHTIGHAASETAKSALMISSTNNNGDLTSSLSTNEVQPLNEAFEKTLDDAISNFALIASKSVVNLSEDEPDSSLVNPPKQINRHNCSNVSGSLRNKFSSWLAESSATPTTSNNGGSSVLSNEDKCSNQNKQNLTQVDTSAPKVPPKTPETVEIFQQQVSAKRHVRKNPLIIPSTNITRSLLMQHRRSDQFDTDSLV